MALSSAQKKDLRAQIKAHTEKRLTEAAAVKVITQLLAQVPGPTYSAPKVQEGRVEGKTFRTYLFEGGQLGACVLETGPNIVTAVRWEETLSEPIKGLSTAMSERQARAPREVRAEVAKPPRAFWGGKTLKEGGRAPSDYQAPRITRHGGPSQAEGFRSVWTPRQNPDPSVEISAYRAPARAKRPDSAFSLSSAYPGEEFHYPGYTEPVAAVEEVYAPSVYAPPVAEAPNYMGYAFQDLIQGILSGDDSAAKEIGRRLSLKGKSALREQTKGALAAMSLGEANALRGALPDRHPLLRFLPVEAAPVAVYREPEPVYVAPAPVYREPEPVYAPPAAPAQDERAAVMRAAQEAAAGLTALFSEED